MVIFWFLVLFAKPVDQFEDNQPEDKLDQSEDKLEPLGSLQAAFPL